MTVHPKKFDSGIRDNYIRGSVGDFLRDKVASNSKLSVVSAYFTIYAYDQLKDKLDAIEDMKFLFGEPSFLKSLDPEKNEGRAFSIKDQKIDLDNQLKQSRVAKDCYDWLKEKVEIRSVKEGNLLHGKMYHVTNAGVKEAIVGSSNFTVRGLGLGDATNNNIELNLEVDSNRDRADLKTWFDELWNDKEFVEDVKEEVLSYLEQLYIDNTPEFVYFKTLYHLFEDYLSAGDDVDEQLQRQIVDSEIWKALFDFQKDGVKGAINKIQQYNGCILADSVGLGKTFEALAVIKYFELKNQNVLVLCPKKLEKNWTIYHAQNNSELNPFLKDRFAYTVLAHTDLSREKGNANGVELATFNWGNYNLVVIDESHNFRNNTPGKKDEDGNIIRRSRYERLIEDIMLQGINTKVLLLSATPVNNSLSDLRNQLHIITEGKDAALKDTLGIESVKNLLDASQRVFTEWAKKEGEHKQQELLNRFNTNFFKLLDSLTIARSRRHITRYYAGSLKAIGGFPKREKPISAYAEIDLSGQFPPYDALNATISDYTLSLFRPSEYIMPQFAELYLGRESNPNFQQQKREYFLIGMMKVGFLKRLESSVNSFHLTMERTSGKIDNLIDRINRFQKFQQDNNDVDIDDLLDRLADDDDIEDAFEVGKKLKIKLAHLELERWLKDLQQDKAQIGYLEALARKVTSEKDGKLKELKTLIGNKVKNPTTNEDGKINRKVLVFTAFTDTADYLYGALKDWARKDLGVHIATVNGSGNNATTFGRADFDTILTNFSPLSKNRNKMTRTMPQDEEIDLLIATDCISEGQNLQDCDYLINYDIHWNPVRVIQRFGRIDRIGSRNKTVQLVNFWPTADLDKYISLKSRVEARMALVDISATTDDNLLQTSPDGEEGIKDLIEADLKYRDKQLKKMKDEILDLEDFNESVSLTDFTLDDFRAQLTRYIESNRKKLADAPTGIFAVVPAPTEQKFDTIKPGVIFCLRQNGVEKGKNNQNPIHPFFLIYMLNDGTTRLSFAQPKQTLDVLQALCSGKKQAYEELAQLFNNNTKDGTDLSQYNELLRRTFQSIDHTQTKRTATDLTSNREALIVDNKHQPKMNKDMELITWLVIMEDSNGQ